MKSFCGGPIGVCKPTRRRTVDAVTPGAGFLPGSGCRYCCPRPSGRVSEGSAEQHALGLQILHQSFTEGDDLIRIGVAELLGDAS